MCISIAPADFKGTAILFGEKDHPTLGQIRTLAYANTVVNHAVGPNAMILHFPSSQRMTQENVVDTSNCPNILKDMIKAAQSSAKSPSFGLSSRSMVQVFEHDIYTVVLGEANAIAEALPLVPSEKRPNLNKALFDYYAQAFPGWQIALCCFNNKDGEKAKPMLWWYYPIDSNMFFAPGIDCHTGGIPQDAPVAVDHWMILASDWMPKNYGYEVQYQDEIPSDVMAFLPKEVVGFEMKGMYANGDFYLPRESALKRYLGHIERKMPLIA